MKIEDSQQLLTQFDYSLVVPMAMRTAKIDFKDKTVTLYMKTVKAKIANNPASFDTLDSLNEILKQYESLRSCPGIQNTYDAAEQADGLLQDGYWRSVK